MSVNSISNTYGTVLGKPANDPGTLDQMDFMELLVAQIRNQDPLSPMDNAEFTSQITQFTMLEELETMNAKMDDNILMGQSINNTAMLGLVGHDVTVEGNRMAVSGGTVAENMVASAGPGTATIEVTDETGHVVAVYTRDIKTGLNDVTWDGKLADGSVAADGDYTISVLAQDSSGETLPFTTLMTGAVQGLRYENNMAVVMVAGLEFLVSDIYKVS
jgi:flagellar basal-body rod modification protein FlgD